MGNNHKEVTVLSSANLYKEYIEELEYMGGSGRQFYGAQDLMDDILYYANQTRFREVLDLRTLVELVTRTN